LNFSWLAHLVGALLFIDGVKANGVGNGVGDDESFADVHERVCELGVWGQAFFHFRGIAVN